MPGISADCGGFALCVKIVTGIINVAIGDGVNGMTQSTNYRSEPLKERLAKIGLAINKYILPIPIIPFLFFATSIMTEFRALGVQKTWPAVTLMIGLLAYPLMYAFSMVLAKKYYEQQKYAVSLMMGLSPLVFMVMAAIGFMSAPI